MKNSSLAYNQHETRDKQPLGRDMDRSWCHLHTSVNLFGFQPMAPWTSTAEYKHMAFCLFNSNISVTGFGEFECII